MTHNIFRWRTTLLRDAEGGGSGGGDGGSPTDGGGSGAGDGSSKEPAWVTSLATSMKTLDGGIRELIAVAQRGPAAQQPAARVEPEEEEPELDATTIETMPRSAWGDHLVSKILKEVNKQVVGPMNERLNELSTRATRNDVQAAVKEAASAHKDFWDWQQEMLTVAKNPAFVGVPAEALYHIVRGQNPDKVKELEAKYNPPTANSGNKPIKLSFGGLTPGQSGTGNRGRKMNGQEAANAAWAEQVKALGGEPVFDEE